MAGLLNRLMVIKRIPAKAPKRRTGGGIRDVSSKGKGWHGEPARHSAAAHGRKTSVEPPTKFQRYVKLVREIFPLIKPDIADQIQEIAPGIHIANIELIGSYGQGPASKAPTEMSDIDILVTYAAPIDELDLDERLAGKIHGFGQIFDVVVKRL